MENRLKKMAALFLLAGAPAIAGCTAQAGAGVTTVVEEPLTGLITFDWTISGDRDPGLCAYYGATDMEVLLYDEAGGTTQIFAPCEDFVVTIETEPGFYDADLTLVDAAGFDASTTLPVDSIAVDVGTELVIDIDFPSTSML